MAYVKQNGTHRQMFLIKGNSHEPSRSRLSPEGEPSGWGRTALNNV